MPRIPGWEKSWTGLYSHYAALILSGKSQSVLAGLGCAPLSHWFSPSMAWAAGQLAPKHPESWPRNRSVAGAQGRMTIHQISHRLSWLALLLLLIKARLSGINQLLCWVPSFCLLASEWLEVYRSNSWIEESLSLIHWLPFHICPQKPSIPFPKILQNIHWTWKCTRHWIPDEMNHVLETSFLHRL